MKPIEPTGGLPVALDYQLTRKEFGQAVRWIARHRPAFPAIVVLGALFVLVGLSGGGETGSVLAGVGIAILIVILASLCVTPAIAWRRNEWVRGPRTLTFSDDGVRTRTSVSEGLMQWTAFKSSYETEWCYMVRMANRAHVVVLKRAFASDQDQVRFRELLKDHIPDARLW